MYLVSDEITGESQAAGLPLSRCAVEIESWSFGVSQPPSIGGLGLSAGTAACSDLHCTFALEQASYQLIRYLTIGLHLGHVKFLGRKTGGGGTPFTYLEIDLDNCFITSFSMGGGSSGIPLAQLSLAYANMTYKYFSQDTRTGGVTLVGSVQYDVKAKAAA